MVPPPHLCILHFIWSKTKEDARSRVNFSRSTPARLDCNCENGIVLLDTWHPIKGFFFFFIIACFWKESKRNIMAEL